MKKILCAFMLMCMIVSCAWADVAVDEANFPDYVFRAYVRESFNKNSDDVLTNAEIADVTEIRVRIQSPSAKFSSVKGIEHFPHLKWLDVFNNEITSIDVSRNTQLVRFDCQNNLLFELDVSKNTDLKNLSCAYNHLRALD